MLRKSGEIIALLQRCPNCGERGCMTEKELTDVTPRRIALGLAPTGTTPLVNTSAFIVTYVVKLPRSRLIITYAHVPIWITSGWPSMWELLSGDSNCNAGLERSLFSYNPRALFSVVSFGGGVSI
jgi:hypothetical protein